MNIQQSHNQKALMLAVISFLIGTILLLIYLISGWEALLIGGFLYVLIAVAVNGLAFIGLLIYAVTDCRNYKENLITLLLFLINIPIAGSYIALVMYTPF